MLAGHDRPPSPGRGRTTERTVSVVEALVDETDGLHLSEMARRCGLPKSSAYRVLSDLAALGMATRLGELYLPGSRLLALASGIESRSALVRRALVLPSLLWLREETGLAAAFSVLRYGRVYYESVVYVSGPIDNTTSAPGWAPTYCTSSGKVLLAYSPRIARHILDGWQPIRHTPRTIVDRDGWESELIRVRQEGVAYNDREYLSEVRSAAVPVVDSHLSFTGAVAVCGTDHEMSATAAGPALRRAAWTAILALRRQADVDNGR